MTTYAYGQKPDTFASIREEAKEPWRGYTALLNNRPYLVIGKDGDKFVLEGEDGDIQSLESFQWTQATEGSRLVSASRHPEAALTKGSVLGQFTIGNLAHEDDEWYVRDGDTEDGVIPLEWIVDRLEQLNNDPQKLATEIRLAAVKRYGLDYGTEDYRCPICSSRAVGFDKYGADEAICQECGHKGHTEDFLNEPPDYDGDTGAWYPDFHGATTAKHSASFEMPLPPQGIHFRTHSALVNAGLQGTVQYPPLPGTEYEAGLTGQFPGNTAIHEMDYSDEAENLGMNLPDITVRVEVPDGQEEQARQIINQLGGLREGKVALEQTDQSGAGETGLESENKAIKCPRCGSHTLRSFGVTQGEAHLKCLTCGNEFARPAMKNPEAKVAGDGKFTPGTRVQMTHQNYKGERGTIVDYSGKHADLGEEQFEIQLDSGEKITSIPESAFNKIKSARVVDNSQLPNTAEEKYMLDSPLFTFVADYPDGKGLKMDTIPLTEFDQNKTPEDYDPKPSDNPHVEGEEPKNLCPMCHEGEGSSLGAMGAREYFRCKNCGMDWSQPNQSAAEAWGKPGEDPDNMFGQDGPDYDRFSSTRLDSKGNKLEPGRVYLMSGKNYTVPDLVRILNLEDEKIEAAIASDAKGAFPIVIEASDEGDYRFEPVEHEDKVTHQLNATSGWKLARKNFTTKEQRDLIEENPDGRARNFDKLDLSGTHYEMKSASDDPDFLWG